MYVQRDKSISLGDDPIETESELAPPQHLRRSLLAVTQEKDPPAETEIAPKDEPKLTIVGEVAVLVVPSPT
jgi:hypothetical protein